MKTKRDPYLQNFAIVTGGLHGRPSGNVAGVVYGAARTRTGKAVTARELVYPSNPQTADQMLQRHIFLESLDATRKLAAACWQSHFNRSIGQLPGFQSMMSIILNNTNSSEEFTAPADTPLGDLHFPGTFACVTGTGASGTVDISWSTETGANGTAGDYVRYVMIGKPAEANYTRYAYFVSGTTARSSGGQVAATGVNGYDLGIGVFFEGQGSASGLLSTCVWTDVTTVA